MSKAHDYARDGELNELKEHLSSPNDIHAKDEVIIQ